MTTAHVEVLTAQVRTLVVGKRQVTASVAKQLDWVDPDKILPFGRIRVNNPEWGQGTGHEISVVGVDQHGNLVVSSCKSVFQCNIDARMFSSDQHEYNLHFATLFEALPLIVLAGLR